MRLTKDVRPDGLGSIDIHVELSGGRKLIFGQHKNGQGVNVKKNMPLKVWSNNLSAGDSCGSSTIKVLTVT